MAALSTVRLLLSAQQSTLCKLPPLISPSYRDVVGGCFVLHQKREMSRKELKKRDKDHLLKSSWSPNSMGTGTKKSADDRYFAVRFEKETTASGDLPPPLPTESAGDADAGAKTKPERQPPRATQMPLHTTSRGEKTFDLPGGSGRGVILPSSSRSKRDILIEQTEAAVEKAAEWLREQEELDKMEPEERKRVLAEANEKLFTEENYRKISQEMWEDLIKDPTMIPELRRMMKDIKLQKEFIDMQTRFDPEQFHGLGALNGIVYASELTGIPVSIARLQQVFELALELKQPLHADLALEFALKPVFIEQATPAFFEYALMVVQTINADLSLFGKAFYDILYGVADADGLDPDEWLPIIRSITAALESLGESEDTKDCLEGLRAVEEELLADEDEDADEAEDEDEAEADDDDESVPGKTE